MAKTVTALVQQTHSPDRVSVFLDGTFAFGVTLEAAAHLYSGQTLDEADIAALRATGCSRTRPIKRRCALWPGGRGSRSELERRLAAQGHGDEAVAEALARLEQQAYVDDGAFAAFWVENRSRFRPRSAAAVAYELRQKGVDNETIRSAVAEVDDAESAWACTGAPAPGPLAGLDRHTLEKKIFDYLARRGFGLDIARRSARRAGKNNRTGMGYENTQTYTESVCPRLDSGGYPGIVVCHRAAYPEYPKNAYYTERFYEMQFAAFSEGQYLAEIDGVIVGYATSLIVQLDDDAHWYTYEEITGGGTFSTHDPSGDTLYGADIGSAP
jgi:regulatory protein